MASISRVEDWLQEFSIAASRRAPDQGINPLDIFANYGGGAAEDDLRWLCWKTPRPILALGQLAS